MKGKIMKVLVLGGVAAGTKAAAKIKREDRSIDVKIITKGKDISYAGCGLPYYISNVIGNRSDLIVNTPAKFTSLTGVEVVTEAVVTSVDFDKKTVAYVCGGRKESESYDKLVIATGAESMVPPVPGVDKEGVFTLRTPDDAEKIKRYASDGNAKCAVVVGAGFIGLEVAENFLMMGLDVTLIDMADSIMPNAFDKEMASRGYFTVDKGSVTVNGVSLTVCNPGQDTFQVNIIPYTYEHTNFHNIKPGTKVNIEFDIIGKYLSRMMSLTNRF